MIILKYETRLQQYKTAVVDDDFDVDAWKRRMIDEDVMTAKIAKTVRLAIESHDDPPVSRCCAGCLVELVRVDGCDVAWVGLGTIGGA